MSALTVDSVFALGAAGLYYGLSDIRKNNDYELSNRKILDLSIVSSTCKFLGVALSLIGIYYGVKCYRLPSILYSRSGLCGPNYYRDQLLNRAFTMVVSGLGLSLTNMFLNRKPVDSSDPPPIGLSTPIPGDLLDPILAHSNLKDDLRVFYNQELQKIKTDMADPKLSGFREEFVQEFRRLIDTVQGCVGQEQFVPGFRRLIDKYQGCVSQWKQENFTPEECNNMHQRSLLHAYLTGDYVPSSCHHSRHYQSS